MIARRAALAFSCLFVGLGHPASAESAADFAERVELPYARNQVIVKYRSEGPAAVGECVESLLREGRVFAQATASGSASLDRLHEKFDVVAATALFRRARPEEDNSIAALRARRQVKNSGSEQTSSLRSARSTGADPVFIDHIYLLETRGETDVEQLCASYRRDPSVEYCHPDRIMEISFVPNDRYFGTSGAWKQGFEDLWGLSRIGASRAWDVARGEGSVVAVVDSGLDYDHPDIAQNVWLNPDEIPDNGVDDDANGFVDDVMGWNFVARNNDPRDRNGHGTHVSGTIAAVMDNGIGIAGVAPASLIMPVKAIRDSGGGLLSELVQGIVYAADEGADVISNSWGNRFRMPADPALIDAVEYAHSQGAVVVASAGNDSADIGGLLLGHHPAGLSKTIAVAASDHLDQAPGFTNFGAGIDVAAPGGDSTDATRTAEYNNILSLRAMGTFADDRRVVDGEYVRLRGTSMATPHVAGLAALLLSLHPEYTGEEVRQSIRASADDILMPGWDPGAGYGRINAPAALAIELPLSALITAPTNGEYVEGVVDVRGVANGSASLFGTNLAGYRLEFGAGKVPSVWQQILESPLGSPSERSLGEWAVPADLAVGSYTLRLVAADVAGAEFESRVLVEVDPRDPPELPGWPLEPNFAHRQHTPMMPSVGDIDMDGDEEIFLGPFAWQHDGTSIVNGPLGAFGDHPVEIGSAASYGGTAAVGDVDGDGRNELVQLHAKKDFTAELLVFDERGQMEAGWPKPIGHRAAFLRNAVPVLADIDGDGVRDIVVASSTITRAVTMIEVYRGDGSSIHSLFAPFVSSNIPAVGDVDGDRLPEIVMVSQFGNVLIWNHDGSDYGVRNRKEKLQNYKLGDRDRVLADRTEITAPTIGDVDGDGAAEIAYVEMDGTVQLFDALRGRVLDGWPKEVGCCDASVPALVDIDQDGDLEIIVGDRSGRVHVWHHDGAYADGWPVATVGSANTTPAVADLDGDGRPDVVTISSDGRTYAWDGRGNDIVGQGWPVHTGEYYRRNFFTSAFGLGASPIVSDLDGDGDREVVAYTEQIHVWDLADAVSPLPVGTEWPMYRFDRFGSADPARAADADLDGVLDEADACSGTPNDEVVDLEQGCSVPQLCGCDAVPEAGWTGRQERDILACISETVDRFRRAGLVTTSQRGYMVSLAKQKCRVD